jgi:hypothetical protein
MMPSLEFIVPGRLDTRTGGYEYDRRIMAGLRALEWTVELHEIDGSFPRPTPAARDEAARVLAAIAAGSVVVVDGLAFGAMPEEAEREARRLRLVALVHMPLADEAGLDRATADRFRASERRALRAARLVIVTGRAMVSAVSFRYGVAPDRIMAVEPGTDRAPLARGSSGGVVELLSVATLNAGKGHEFLFRALASVPRNGWHLTCAGSLERDPATVARLCAQLHADGLEDKVTLAGELRGAALARCYDRADVFVSASVSETYGMAIAEALARGLPVVGNPGALFDLVLGPPGHATDPHNHAAGLVVPPDKVDLFSQALDAVIGDKDLRGRLAAAAGRARDRLPTWEDASRRMAAALEPLAVHE